jgi:hypothetical protein
MMRVAVLLVGGEVAFVLASHLGPAQNWENVLNDFRQGRRNFGCDPLLPVARAKRGERAPQPLYQPSDVRDFVEAVRRVRGSDKPFALRARRYLVESDDTGLPWSLRTAEPVKAPAATLTPL